MNFKSLGLDDDLTHALEDKQYSSPTPIQSAAIPAILENRDLMAAAQTGTGKTAGFTLPILQKLLDMPHPRSYHCYALILVPTRELAAQVQESIISYSKYLKIRSAVVFGGVNIKPQIKELAEGVDILVATPGRLMDLHQQQAVEFNDVNILVLDEADRMLDMGFIRDIKKIISLLPSEAQSQRQNLLFSATFSPAIRHLARSIFKNDPMEIDIAPRNQPIELVNQTVYTVDKLRKAKLLGHVLNQNQWNQVLVFCRTKQGADRLVSQLNRDKIDAVAIHGDKSQRERTDALGNFKNGNTRVLVATDIAARGIDISELPHVINFDLPDAPEDYVHRIGRTGRAGCPGDAISLVSFDEHIKLRSIERLIKKEIPRETIEGFEPELSVPATSGKNAAKLTRSFSPRKFSGSKSYRGLGSAKKR